MGREAKPNLSRASPSFRLRNPSLNTLRLRRIFDVFDSNGDGVITLLELRQALHQLGLEADPSELDSTVRYHIRPGKPGLVFEDFVSLHRSLGDSLFGAESGSESEPESDSDMKEAFKVFDEDGDGFISAVQLQMVLEKLGLQEGKEMDSVRQMICSVDRDRDGRVDFGEFKEMMQRVSVTRA